MIEFSIFHIPFSIFLVEDTVFISILGYFIPDSVIYALVTLIVVLNAAELNV